MVAKVIRELKLTSRLKNIESLITLATIVFFHA